MIIVTVRSSLMVLARLVTYTRLYSLPCRSVGRSVGRSVSWPAGRSVGPSVHASVRHIDKFRPNFAVLLLPNRPRLDCRVSGLVLVNCYSQQGNYPALRVVSLLVFFYWLFGYTIFVFGYTIIVFIMGSGAEIQFLYFFFPARCLLLFYSIIV